MFKKVLEQKYQRRETAVYEVEGKAKHEFNLKLLSRRETVVGLSLLASVARKNKNAGALLCHSGGAFSSRLLLRSSTFLQGPAICMRYV
jgi:hypothetical protein